MCSVREIKELSGLVEGIVFDLRLVIESSMRADDCGTGVNNNLEIR